MKKKRADNYTVRVVDDDPLISKFVTVTMRGRNYTVVTAADGKPALEIFISKGWMW